MEFRKEISNQVCEKLNCQFLKKRSNGEKYCQAYFPECDEYEDYEEYLNLKKEYSILGNKLEQLTKRLTTSGINPELKTINWIGREARWL